MPSESTGDFLNDLLNTGKGIFGDFLEFKRAETEIEYDRFLRGLQAQQLAQGGNPRGTINGSPEGGSQLWSNPDAVFGVSTGTIVLLAAVIGGGFLIYRAVK